MRTMLIKCQPHAGTDAYAPTPNTGTFRGPQPVTDMGRGSVTVKPTSDRTSEESPRGDIECVDLGISPFERDQER